MRSGTSFFNSTLYHKTMQRFWPLWALYGMFWLFALPLSLLNGYFDRVRWGVSDARGWLLQRMTDAPELLTMGVILAAGFSVLCAMAVFSYLYNNRSACMMHALPLRRENLFTTQYLAGLSFMLLPHLAVAVLTMAVEMAFLAPDAWSTALWPLLVWLLAQSGVCLFFFSFASFCAMFTGHILALPAFYGILNFLVLGLYQLISELARSFYYGYSASYDNPLVEYCTPVVTLFNACEWDLYGPARASRCLSSPGTVAAYAAVGVALAVLALLVYQRRQVESAGDVVAVPVVRPIFKYGVAICVGLALGTFTAVFFNWFSNGFKLGLCMLFWAAVGYFAAEMLLKKSFRVLNAWKGCAVMAVVLALLCAVAFRDFFGLETRVPAANEVESILMYDGPQGAPYDGARRGSIEITDPEQIEKLIALHQAIVDERDRKDQPGDDYLYYNMEYTLKDGGTFRRCYRTVPLNESELETPGTVSYAAQQIVQDRDYVRRLYGLDTHGEDRLVEAYLDNVWNEKNEGYFDQIYLNASGAELEELWQAVLLDFEEGSIGVRYLIDDGDPRQENTYRTDLNFRWEKPVSVTSIDRNYEGVDARTHIDDVTSITLTPQAVHTLGWLEKAGGYVVNANGVTPAE